MLPNPISQFVLEGVILLCQPRYCWEWAWGLSASSWLPFLPRWALWFFKNDRNRSWQENLQLVTKFDTVEDFWA